jgi:hypothetical protein
MNDNSTAFDAGYWDAQLSGHARLVMLHLAVPTDRELSDYWQGWHTAKRHIREALEAKRDRRNRR